MQEKPQGPDGKPVSAADDAELIRRIQTGNVREFAELVVRYQDRVYNTCWRMCGHAEDARDLTQETFLHAFRRIGEFRLDSRFYTWLFRIAVNLAISHRRKARHRAAWSLDADDEGTAEGGRRAGSGVADPATPTPDAALNLAEEKERLAQALRRLDEAQRTVVVLRDIEGLSYEDIAEVLEVPIGTVRSRLHRARLELTDWLHSEKAQGKPA